MNNFVLVPIDELSTRYIRYYTVRLVGKKSSEFEDWVARMMKARLLDAEIDAEFRNLMTFIKYIGNNLRCAWSDGFFRHEGAASALPPPAYKARSLKRSAEKKGDERTAAELEAGSMRLYCMPLNDRVVVLFNGDVKTPGKRSAQECPRVARLFKDANKMAKALDEAIKAKDIEWNSTRTDIIYPTDLEIEP